MFYIVGLSISIAEAATTAPFDPFADQQIDFFAFTPVTIIHHRFVFIDPRFENDVSRNPFSSRPACPDPLIDMLLEFFSPPPRSKL